MTHGDGSDRAGDAVFDLVVIGSGPAGEKAATHAAYFGKRVAVVERSLLLGGAVVSNAGVPTKTLRETALYITGIRKRDVYGVRVELDRDRAFEVLRQRTGHVVETMAARVQANLDRHGIEVVRGTARILSPQRVAVTDSAGGETVLETGVVLVATGSRPFHPPGLPFSDPDLNDSDTMLALDRPFDSILVVGGGPIGCEYASILAALDVEVTLVDLGPRLAPALDQEISALLAGALKDLGVRLEFETGVDAVARDGEGLRVLLTNGELVRPAKVLVAAGRSGNTAGLGLEGVGVDLDNRGRVIVDENYQTTCPGIYAAGDVIGPPALASVSMEQGRIAASHAFGTELGKGQRYEPPFGIYSVPEAAMVGLTEEEASKRGIDYAVGRGWFTTNSRANIAGATEGLVKLVFRQSDRRLLGVHILGDFASELIHIGQGVMQNQGTIDYFVHATFNVPTWSDAYKYAAFDGLQTLEPGALVRAGVESDG
jgi:NAD(P) transhydrogenase